MKVYASIALIALALAGTTPAQELFSDDFNSDSSADYTLNTSSDDTEVEFGFDYATLGIPVAPNTTDASTLGLRLAGNLVEPGGAEAVTLATIMQFTGDFSVSFDGWMNANGPFPSGGGGSTEFITIGLGSDGATVNQGGQGGATGSGAWAVASGEGGSSRDYGAYKNDAEQFGESGQYAATQNNNDVYYSGFGGIDVGTFPVQGNIAQQNGTSAAGSFGFAWHRVTLAVDSTGGTGGAAAVTWTIDGLRIATLDAGIGDSFTTDGSATVGMMDIFSSVSDNAQLSFCLIDNLVVEVAQASTIRIAQSQNFAILNQANATSTLEFVIENRGLTPITLNEVNFTGEDAASFSLDTGLPFVIAAAESETVNITYTASGDTGGKTAQVEFISTDGLEPSVILSLSATYAEELLAHYKLDETEGVIMVEATGNGPDGAFIIRDPLAYAQAELATGTAIGFSAADSGNSGNLALATPLHVPTTSISLWVQRDADAVGQDVLFNRDPGFTGADAIYGCFVDDFGRVTYRAGGVMVLQSAEGAVPTGSKHHVVITHLDEDGFGNDTATRARMYIDGVMVAENTEPTGFDAYPGSASTRSLFIASRTAAGSGLDGFLDDIQIYSIEITPGQVSTMFRVPGLTASMEAPVLRITDVSYDMDAGTVTLTWDSIPGQDYYLEGTTTLQPFRDEQNWQELEDSIVSQGISTTYTYTGVSGPLNFFRVSRQ